MPFLGGFALAIRNKQKTKKSKHWRSNIVAATYRWKKVSAEPCTGEMFRNITVESDDKAVEWNTKSRGGESKNATRALCKEENHGTRGGEKNEVKLFNV